jgi:hypothetical protein
MELDPVQSDMHQNRIRALIAHLRSFSISQQIEHCDEVLSEEAGYGA